MLKIDKERLLRLMLFAGIDTQEELASASGHHVKTLNGYINGRYEPTKGVIVGLCRALRCQPGEFLVYVDQKKTPQGQ